MEKRIVTIVFNKIAEKSNWDKITDEVSRQYEIQNDNQCPFCQADYQKQTEESSDVCKQSSISHIESGKKMTLQGLARELEVAQHLNNILIAMENNPAENKSIIRRGKIQDDLEETLFCLSNTFQQYLNLEQRSRAINGRKIRHS